MTSWIEIRLLDQMPGLSRRVAEKAAWRDIVRERLGEEVSVGYNKNGAPILKNAIGYISVSHTTGWVAVIWSPSPCAIDIELKTRRLTNDVADRYGIATIEEWCALEAGYKFKGLTGRPADLDSVRFLPHPELTIAVISYEL